MYTTTSLPSNYVSSWWRIRGIDIMAMALGWGGGRRGCIVCEEVPNIGEGLEGSEERGKGIGRQGREGGGGEDLRGFQ